MKRTHWHPYLLVALGSALGGSCRLLLSDWSLAYFGHGFPWGNLLVNVLGSALIGFYAALPAGRRFTGGGMHLFVTAGFCGGFTTFSLFSLETLALVADGAWLMAGSFVLLSIILWLAAVSAGYLVGKQIHLAEPIQ